DVAVSLDDVEVAVSIEAQLVGHVERRVERRAAVARVAALPVSDDAGDRLRGQVEAANPLVVEVAEVERAIRADHESERGIDLRRRVAANARPDDSGNSRGHPCAPLASSWLVRRVRTRVALGGPAGGVS